MTSPAQYSLTLTYRRIISTWWPLAASWILMGAEGPAISAVVARLINPEIHLAAYGGVVFPLALIIESPIIMLLAASTALSTDWISYRKLYRFMMAAGAALTGLHLLVAFTPLFDFVVRGLLNAPAEIVEPARIGLRIMTPWTWAIAYRRFNQGVLIRFGHSHTIGIGTVVRLSADTLVLVIGYVIADIPGVVVAATAVAAGVICEAIYAGLTVRPVLRTQLHPALPTSDRLTLASFLAFYVPLALTSLLTLLVQPLGSAAIGRMPDTLSSLAAWPVVTGLIFILRGVGMALNEVVVALLDQPQSSFRLHRFALWLAGLVTLLIVLLTATPLSALWFERVSALSPRLAELSRLALWLGLPLPALTVFQSWYQGILLHSRQTRGVTEAVVVFLLSSAILLRTGIAIGSITGIYVGMASFSISTALQTLWLAYRARPHLRTLRQRDAHLLI